MKKLINGELIFALLFIACFTNTVDSQTDFIYGKQFGSDKNDFACNSASDKFGNVFIVGETNGAIAGPSFGKTDGFISKFDSIGNTIWSKQIGTNEDDKINDLVIDQSGNIYVTGYTKGIVNNKNFGNEDIIVCKFDNTGNIVWQKQYGTDSTDIGNMIYVDIQGNIFVSGITNGAMGKSSYGLMDCIVLKLDNKGNSIWNNQFGTSKKDECQGITGDSLLNIYVCGLTMGDLAISNNGKGDAFAGKFTDKGELLKLFQFGTVENDMANHIAVDKEKNIYVGGSTAGDLGGKQQGDGDGFLSMLNKNFEIIWTQQFGTNKWDGVNGMALNEKISENIIVSGCQNWPSCQSFIRMYKNDGSLLWVRNYIANGKNGGTCGKGVCIDNKGNIYHTGGTGGNLFKSIDKPEGDDVFLIKLIMD
jgi:hypothetical protein